jgi:two-component system, cell cycle response regulator DivK
VSSTTILIVDDNEDNRNVFSLLLELSGFSVLKAADGRNAVQQARAYHPDLILMDISMPTMDGFEATELLKFDPHTRDIPVIALSAHDDAEHRMRALEVGMSGYLSKPARPGRVLDEVIRCLNGVTNGDRRPQFAVRRSRDGGETRDGDRLSR